MDHLSEMSSIKHEMEVAAFSRWQQQTQQQVPSPIKPKGISELTRENNFQLRKNFRDSKGLTKISEELW